MPAFLRPILIAATLGLVAEPLGAAKPIVPIVMVPPLPDDYRDWVREVILASLKDPDSAKLEYRVPPYLMLCEKGVFRKAPVEIWMIDLLVNAKNSFGGYTGFVGWSVAMSPAEGNLVNWQAYTRPGGGALSEYKLCRRIET